MNLFLFKIILSIFNQKYFLISDMANSTVDCEAGMFREVDSGKCVSSCNEGYVTVRPINEPGECRRKFIC